METSINDMKMRLQNTSINAAVKSSTDDGLSHDTSADCGTTESSKTTYSSEDQTDKSLADIYYSSGNIFENKEKRFNVFMLLRIASTHTRFLVDMLIVLVSHFINCNLLRRNATFRKKKAYIDYITSDAFCIFIQSKIFINSYSYLLIFFLKK